MADPTPDLEADPPSGQDGDDGDRGDGDARVGEAADPAVAPEGGGRSDGTDGDRPRWARRGLVAGRCLLAGVCLAASVPPWGWWPLAFVGIAVWDRVLADQRALVRFRRTWLVVAAWLFPSMLWMFDLTAPGYVIAVAAYAAYFGVAMALVPPGRWRWLGLPGAVIVAEWARWTFPFGGVPLATLAMGQADAPLAVTARLGNALLLSGLVAVGGVALAAAWVRRWRPAAIAAGVVVVAVLVAQVAPDGRPVGTMDVAIVQGGGPQRTRASETDERVVFERHLNESTMVDTPVDLVLWPENVVSVEGRLVDNVEQRELEALSDDLGAPVVAGVTEGISDTEFLNASIVIVPEGQVDRYDKVLRVPFGEYVPLRSLLESLAPGAGLPRRDAVPGVGPAVVDVPLPDGEVVPMGIVISWEVFFTARARDAVRSGGEIILNPTNGSSYWLTQVQTQQVASSRLRALETGRWVLQAAPTGFSAVVTPDGEVLERTSISEAAVLAHTVERRTGLTLASRFGQWPALLGGIAAMAAAWVLTRRDDGSTAAPAGAGAGADAASAGGPAPA